MKLYFYWGIVAIFGLIHLQSIFIELFRSFPIYITVIFVGIMTNFLYKKITVRISSLDLKINGFLFAMQLIVLIISLLDINIWISLLSFLLFLGIELFRIKTAEKLFFLNKEMNEFKVQRKQMNETFRIVRSERHDFLKHISALHFMLEHEKITEAREYLNHLVDGYEETNLSIKGEKGSVAGILHQMYQKAKKANIEVIYDLDLPLSSLPLDDKDIVELIGNLLSNSIDACEEWQKTRGNQATLTLQFYKRSGLFLLICKNNCLPIPTEIVDMLYQSYGKTTKGEGHEGLGTKLIHDVVNKHQGFLDFVHKDEEFTVKIKIPAIR